jgi:DNA helicase-2/ATP-dependent DNA helicase PcrA
MEQCRSDQKESNQVAEHELLNGLNEDQRAAVLAIEGPVLVVAGPGSGKTRVLSHRVAYLIKVCGVSPDRIMAVTFTNKAAKEMRVRIERLLGTETATRGLVMGTFHSLGVRFLRQHPGIVADRLGILPNFLIYDDADQIEISKRAIVTVGHDPKVVAPRRVLSRISAAKSMLITPEEFAQQHIETYDDEIIARIYREYQRGLRRANAVDFDDLLALPLQLFDAAPNLLELYQERLQHVLVDEYQDTNRVQYILVSGLSARHRNLFVVGDPDQSIYAWRQADIRNILDFQTDFPDARQINLGLNYRSTRRIVDTADRVIRENRLRIERPLRTHNDDGEHVIVRELSDQNHEARFIVGEIRRLKEGHGIRPDQVAVMYRTTAQSRVLEEAFRISDIPYRIVGGVRFYERKEVKDVLAVLKLLYNPADELSLQRVIDNLPIGRGIGPKAVDAVRAWAVVNQLTLANAYMELGSSLHPPDISGNARGASIRLGRILSNLRSRVGELTLSQLFDAIIEETGYRGSFDRDSEDEMQRFANVLELRTDLARYDEMAPADALTAYLEQIALVADVDQLDDNDRPQVTLITLHSAKGLEFPVVFIAGVEEGLLPINRAVETEFHDTAALEEERRLFYVGITRAEKLLYITYAGIRMLYGRTQPTAPSRFLASLPEHHVKSLGSRQASWTGRPSLIDRAKASHLFSSLSGSAAPATVVIPVREFATGERVFHPKFGEGVVAEAIERHSDQELAIDFTRHGRKRLLASLAQLEVIE